MIRYALLLLFGFLLFSCKKTDIAKGLETATFTKYGETRNLPIDQTADLLSIATEMNKTYLIWKGHDELVLKYKNGKTYNLKVSRYGGFFYCYELDQHFEIPESRRDEWNELVGVKKIKL